MSNHENATTPSGGAGDYDYDTDYRRHFDTTYSNRGYDYEGYRPAYDYGRTLANDPRYQGRSWRDVEANARRDWEQRNPNSPWDNVKDAVQHAWDSVTGHNH